MARVDVLMPVRNGLPYLHEAINSIRGQTVKDWRLHVLDHGSSDGSLELAQWHAQSDGRISVHSHPEAASLAELRNAGLAKCDCRYLMLQDADDVSFRKRMEVVDEAFAAAPRLLAIGGEAIVIDPAGKRIDHLRMPADPKAVAAASFFYFPMLHPTLTVDFGALQRFGGAYGRDILNVAPQSDSVAVAGLAEDYILFAQLALLGPCANIATPLIRYRRHPASVGISNAAAQIDLSLEISRFLAKSFCLMNGLYPFDPAPFCNHADYVFDLRRGDYSAEFAHMADVLRQGLGASEALERELSFRWVLATRNSGEMALRFLKFQLANSTSPSERRTVRNWLLRDLRQGKYVYRPSGSSTNRTRMVV